MLKITPSLREQVIAHCQSRFRKEACGLLAGAKGETAMRVVEVYPMTNVEDSPIGYSMDPVEQLRVDKQMRQRNQRLIGIYHSHTASPAEPSPVDVGLALSPDLAYVLVSLKDRQHPDFKSYRIDGKTITPEEVVVEA